MEERMFYEATTNYKYINIYGITVIRKLLYVVILGYPSELVDSSKGDFSGET